MSAGGDSAGGESGGTDAPASKPFAKLAARERITQVIERWFLTEPLLFAAWTMHDVVENPNVKTIRIGRGRIEFNPQFIRSLKRGDLNDVLAFEAMRILLGHPYARRQPNPELSYMASNLSVQECVRSSLPIPRAREVFGDPGFDHQYFEFYYRELSGRSSNEPPPEQDKLPDFEDQDEDQQDQEGPEAPQSAPPNPGEAEQGQEAVDGGESTQEDAREQGDEQAQEQTGGEAGREEPGLGSESKSGDQNRDSMQASEDLESYTDPFKIGVENTQQWDQDDLQQDEIHAAVREAAETQHWGAIGAGAKEQLLATLQPKLDYRAVLQNFRQSVLSIRRRLTRMKPSRRYGMGQMGSRYDFTTRLLFAVDVSGSMSQRDLQLGFSVVSRFFRYGVETVDVIWFDEQVRCEPMTLRRARTHFEVSGRGGTNFRPVIEFIDEHQEYDGLIIFTDGYAPVPAPPVNRKTRVLWLFKDEATYLQMHDSLAPIGRAAFLRES
jgi:predicted metal-dependent peptidase